LPEPGQDVAAQRQLPAAGAKPGGNP